MESYAAAAGDLQAVGKTEIRDERMLVKCSGKFTICVR